MKNIFEREHDKEVFELIKSMKTKDGLTYEEIADKLNHRGYSGVNGSKLSQPVVSRFMVDRGYRVFEPHRRNKQSNGRAKPIMAPRLAATFENDILEVLNGNFSKKAKVRILQALIAEDSL